jgi:hypothetical protein
VHGRSASAGSSAASARGRRSPSDGGSVVDEIHRVAAGKGSGNGLRRCAIEREGKWARKQRSWLADSSSSARSGRGTGRSPARNFDGLAASQVTGGEGKAEEVQGYL